ncbi:MAG: hypothetical protein ABJB33_06185 [Gemmatimonadota bacterium]
MKPLMIAGLALIALGIMALVKAPSYGTARHVVQIGDLRVTAQQEEMVPPWIGGLGLAGGLVLVGSGLLGRRPA